MGISAAASVYGILSIKNGEVGLFFVGLYMLIFAVILGLYELMQFMPVEKIVDLYRWNFGFFFDIKGKALYMIFIAFLNFGFLSDDGETSRQHDLSIAAGTLLLFMGLPNLVFGLAFKGVLKDTVVE